MALRSRAQLEAHFKNGARPSQTEFAELIASQLNRRDDQFLGRWRAGTIYREGDVVIHARTFWTCTVPEHCAEEPPEAGGRWSVLTDRDDGDWLLRPAEVSESGRGMLLTPPDVDRVGIGTTRPEARLTIEGTSDSPAVLLRGTDQVASHLVARPEPVGEGAEESPHGTRHETLLDATRLAWTTDAPEGFELRWKDAALLVVRPDADRKVRMGVGTEEPATTLEVAGRGRAREWELATGADSVTETGELSGVLEDVANLRPIRFQWSEAGTVEGPIRELGLVAEEVAAVWPELVTGEEDGPRGISVGGLLAALVGAVQEQQTLIEALTERVDELESGAE